MLIRKAVTVFCIMALLLIGSTAVQAAVLDLTGGGSGTINDAIFQWTAEQPTGSGVIDSFVRMQTNDTVEQGYNTSYRLGAQAPLDDNNSPIFTRDLLLSSVPIVSINGTDYRQFLLDINQTGSQPLLSLDSLQIYMNTVGGLDGSPSNLGTLIYDLGDNWIKLDASLNHGSGSGDMLAFIPDNLFTDGPYVYLYSRFGDNIDNNNGYEEWAVLTGPSQVPEPGTLLILGAGLLGLPLFRRKLKRA